MRSLLRFVCVGVLLAAFPAAVFAGDAKKDQKKDAKKAPKKANVFLDPIEAGADYAVQGEYVGTIAGGAKLGCQVIALGNATFQAVILPGGLPGDGWNGKDKILMDGSLDGIKVLFTPTEGKRKYMAGSPKEFSATAKFPPMGHKLYTAALAEGILSGKTDDGKEFTLKKTARSSPTLNAKPPEGAIILFDGKNADEWKSGKNVDGLLSVPANTKAAFKDFKLHIEFRTPFQPTARSQGRGNSGVYLHGRHEIQVLDSFGLDGKNNECGGFYGRREPSVNMCYPPLVWQTFDVEFKSEPADPKSKKQTARITVHHNGVKIHDALEFPSGQGPINLQNHGNPVFFRNIWLVELK